MERGQFVKNNKQLKEGYFRSLVYMYKNAREKAALYDYEAKKVPSSKFADHMKQAQRDILRFCEILNEVIGEHD